MKPKSSINELAQTLLKQHGLMPSIIAARNRYAEVQHKEQKEIWRLVYWTLKEKQLNSY